MEPNAAHPQIVEMASPPRRCPTQARAASNRERLSPDRVASWPINRNNGSTESV